MLLGLQAAFGVALVTGAAVTVPGFVRIMRDRGFDVSRVQSVQIERGWKNDGSDGERYSAQRVNDTLSIIRATRGVAGAAAVTQWPVGISATSGDFWRRSGAAGGVWGVSDEAFATLGIAVRVGRPITADDVTRDEAVAVLNELGARMLWPDASPSTAVGRAITVEGRPHVVIGIIGDISTRPGEAPIPSLFLPITSPAAPVRQTGLIALVKSAPAIDANIAAMREGLARRFGDGPVTVTDVAATLDEWRRHPRFLAAIFGTLSVTAVVLATVGVYAVASFEGARRRHEIALRLALGATRRDVRRLVTARVVAPVATGAICGAVASWFLVPLARSAMTDVGAPGIGALVGIVGLLVSTAAFGGWIPARRAAQADAATVLKEG
jgi:hypothetical protein